MKSSEVMKLINEIEDKFSVTRWMIDDIHIWPLIRISIAYQLYNVTNFKTTKIPKLQKICNRYKKILNLSKNYFDFVWAYYKDKGNNISQDIPADIVFLGYTTNRHLINNSWYDIFCNPYITRLEQANITSLLLELSPNHEYRIPRYSPSIFIQPQIDTLKLISYFDFRKNKFSDYLEDWASFEVYLLDKLGFKIIDINDFKYQVILIKYISIYFKNILLKSKASLGFVINYYGVVGMAFNLACRELNIASVDIQHGMQGQFHAAYASWNQIPTNGYKLLPTKFWCWSEFEAITINQWNKNISGDYQPIVGGNLWLDMWQEKNSKLALQYDLKISNFKNLDPDSIHILFTLQPRNDLGLTDWILKTIRESPASWFWWIRLHPGMMSEREKIRQLLKQCQPANVELDRPTDIPLLALLRNTDVHVTHCSSTVIEAESFDVPSVITHIVGTECFSDQIASGAAISAYNTADLLVAIQVQAKKKITLNSKTKKSSMLSHQALQQIISMVQEQKLPKSK